MKTQCHHLSGSETEILIHFRQCGTLPDMEKQCHCLFGSESEILLCFRQWNYNASTLPGNIVLLSSKFCNLSDTPHFRLVIYAGDIFGTSFPVPTSVARITFLLVFLLPEDRNNTGRFTGMQPTSRKVHPTLILCICSGLGFCRWLSTMALAGQSHCHWLRHVTVPASALSTNCPAVAACYSPWHTLRL